MNWRAVRAVIRKDLKVVLQNKGVSIPMLVIPLIVLVVLPSMAAFVPLLQSSILGLYRLDLGTVHRNPLQL